MGFFKKTKKIITVSVVNNHLIDAANFPHTIKESVLASIKKGESIPTNLIAASITNFSSKVRKYQRFGETGYVNRLPTSSSILIDPPLALLTSVFSQVEGESVSDLEASFDFLDPNSFGLVYMQDTYGWESHINIITLNGVNFEFFKLEFFPEEQSTPDGSPLPNRIELSYREIANNSNVVVESVDTPPQSFTYYFGSYRLTSQPAGHTIYFFYDTASHIHPELDLVGLNSFQDVYYPIAILRSAFRNINSDRTGVPFKSTKKLLQKISIDVDTTLNAINSNGNIGIISDSFINFAINMGTEVEESKLYLYKYFFRLGLLSGTIPDTFNQVIQNNVNNGTSTRPPFTVFSVTEGTYNTLISFNFITITTFQGKVGQVGKASKQFIANAPLNFDGTFDNLQGFQSNIEVNNTQWVLTLQETETTYTEVRVQGLTTRTVIGGKNASSNSGNIDSLMIPISKTVVDTLNSFQEEIVLLDGLNLAIYTFQVKKVKVFSGFFKIFILVVAVAVSIFFSPVASAGFSALTEAAVVSLVTKLAISFAIGFLAKKIGGAAGAIFSIVAFIYLPTKFGGLGGELSNMPWAETALKLTSGVINTVSNSELAGTQSELQKLQQRFDSLDSQVSGREKQINDAKDLLADPNFTLDPLYILNVGLYFNLDETPDSYFNRTLNTDPGSTTLEAIDVFVENSLELPTTNMTLQPRNTQSQGTSSVGWFTI